MKSVPIISIPPLPAVGRKDKIKEPAGAGLDPAGKKAGFTIRRIETAKHEKCASRSDSSAPFGRKDRYGVYARKLRVWVNVSNKTPGLRK
jgi:hypothetical protein